MVLLHLFVALQHDWTASSYLRTSLLLPSGVARLQEKVRELRWAIPALLPPVWPTQFGKLRLPVGTELGL